MKTITPRRFAAAFVSSLLLSTPLILLGDPTTPVPPDKDKEEDIIVLSPFEVTAVGATGYSAGSTLAGVRLGATVGGAKDARFFRDAAEDGGFPHPNTITAEGLFSEHDLPLQCRTESKELFILNGEAMPAALLTKPEVKYLGQIGLSSGLDAATWHREPLNLVAVVDKSGSMDGEPLALVRKCLGQIHSQLGPDDQLSIVLYGDTSHVHLAPTPATKANRAGIAAAIAAIESSGSTNMEEGLQVGFALARQSQTSFRGRTRVMQFTDERPNVGDTTAGGFMGIMEAGSRDGIGQTTVGVGVDFGAELASKVSSVRGGNLFFFPDEAAMVKTFTEDLDTMVTELAHDLDVTIRPAAGLRLVGVYGIPGEMLKWEGDRDVRFQVTTVFLSKSRGAIYAAFAPEAEDLPERRYVEGRPLAAVGLSYREVGSTVAKTAKLELPLVSKRGASVGLTRGRLLVSEYLALKSAMTAHLTENNQEKAYVQLGELHELLAADSDRTMADERKLVAGLYTAMAKLSGHGERVANFSAGERDAECAGDGAGATSAADGAGKTSASDGAGKRSKVVMRYMHD
ncbi:MAG: VWA domain-containing protein [Opitutaceae bacterium]|nr:VWA domain-containing protein [Opitutaceae bacterium]